MELQTISFHNEIAGERPSVAVAETAFIEVGTSEFDERVGFPRLPAEIGKIKDILPACPGSEARLKR